MDRRFTSQAAHLFKLGHEPVMMPIILLAALLLGGSACNALNFNGSSKSTSHDSKVAVETQVESPAPPLEKDSEEPDTSHEDETAITPLDTTGVYLIGCEPPLVAENTATLNCAITDSEGRQVISETEAVWSYKTRKPLMPGQTITVLPHNRNVPYDAAFIFAALSQPELLALMQQTVLRAVLLSDIAETYADHPAVLIPSTKTVAEPSLPAAEPADTPTPIPTPQSNSSPTPTPTPSPPPLPTAQCTAGSRQCSGNIPQVCDASLKWQNEAACPDGCEAGACLLNLTGTWQFSIVEPGQATIPASMTITQTPGSLSFSGTSSDKWGTANLTGTYSTTTRQFSMTQQYKTGISNGESYKYEGTLSGTAKPRTISGTWSELGYPSYNGTFSATEQ